MTAYAVRYPRDGCAVFCLSADEHRALCGVASDKAGKRILRKVPGWFVWAKPSRALDFYTVHSGLWAKAPAG